MFDPERIRFEGVKLLDELSSSLEDIPESEETHYVVDLINIYRKDGEPGDCEGFREKFSKIVPNYYEGYVVTEKEL